MLCNPISQMVYCFFQTGLSERVPLVFPGGGSSTNRLNLKCNSQACVKYIYILIIDPPPFFRVGFFFYPGRLVPLRGGLHHARRRGKRPARGGRLQLADSFQITDTTNPETRILPYIKCRSIDIIRHLHRDLSASHGILIPHFTPS